jgi:hypothetical protein
VYDGADPVSAKDSDVVRLGTSRGPLRLFKRVNQVIQIVGDILPFRCHKIPDRPREVLPRSREILTFSRKGTGKNCSWRSK